MTNNRSGSQSAILEVIRKRQSMPSIVLGSNRARAVTGPVRSQRAEGMILLQTLMMVLILAMIGIMTLKWVLGRHMITTKVSKSINCKALADACLAQKIAAWGGTDPSNGTHWCSIETAKDVKVTVSGPAGGKEITFKVDYDNCGYH